MSYTKKPCICFVMRFESKEKPAGAEIQAENLASELVKLGWNVHYVCRSLSGLKETVERSGVVFHYIGHHRKFFEWLDFPKIYKVVRAIQPDILYQRFTSVDSALLGWISLKFHIPYAWNDTDDKCLELDIAKSRVIWNKISGSTVIRSLKLPVIWFNAVFVDWLVDYGLKRATVRLTQNQLQAQQAFDRFGQQTIMISSGHPRPSELYFDKNANTITVIWAGNLGYRKSPETVIEIARRCQGNAIIFELFGSGGISEDRKQIFYDFKELSNIRYHGRQHLDIVNHALDKADFLLNTSTYEGFPNTFIQAWLRGVPVLTTGVNPDSILNNHILGRTFSNIEEISDFLKNEIHTPYYTKEKRKKIAQYADKHFNIAKIALQYEVIFKNLITGARGHTIYHS